MSSPRKSKIILGVTGGIAAYKACELVRLFKKAGHEVRVVMSANAERFVGALTFHSLSGEPVLRSLDGTGYDLSATSHIDLAQWGELLVVAPATANFLAKLSCGIADDALLTECLAFRGPALLAPAMNTRMWEAASTQTNLEVLRERGYEFAGPVAGDLACGETG
ncbi:MAG: flavoprotein, partial [Bdellovibrionota bacterium]